MSARLIAFNTDPDRFNPWVELVAGFEPVNISDPDTFIELCQMEAWADALRPIFRFIIDERLKHNEDGPEIGVHTLTADLKWAGRLSEHMNKALLPHAILTTKEKLTIMAALFAQRAFDQNAGDSQRDRRMETATDDPDLLYFAQSIAAKLQNMTGNPVKLTDLSYVAEVAQCLYICADIEKYMTMPPQAIQDLGPRRALLLNDNMRNVMAYVREPIDPVHTATYHQITRYYESRGQAASILPFRCRSPKG